MAFSQPEWFERAKCRTLSIAESDAMFFPETKTVRDARVFCEGLGYAGGEPCPVRDDCLEYALTTRTPYGVWGGVSERGRRRILEGRNKRAR